MCTESVACTREVETRNPPHVRARSVGREVLVGAGVRFVQDLLTGA